MKKTLALLLLIIIIGCSQNDPNKIIIHGSTNRVGNAFLTTIGPVESKIDTANIQNGSFNFSQTITEQTLYKLSFDSGFIYKWGDMNLLISPGEKININYDTLGIKISGSEGSIKIQELNRTFLTLKNFQEDLTKEMQETTALYSKNDPKTYNSMMESYKKDYWLEIDNYRDTLKNFIDDNINSKACLLALFAEHAPRSYILNIDEDLAYFEKCLKSLKTNFPESNYIEFLQQRIDIAKPLALGQPAPNFTLPDINNTPVSLSDLKGKVVLIDFWASWCKPCRIENPKLVKIHDKYADSNFEILSVSLDGNPRQKEAKKDWQKAIQQDNLSNFIHVSELKGFQTIVQQLYNFNSIPYTVLVDEEGKIVAKGLRGDELEMKIAQLLN